MFKKAYNRAVLHIRIETVTPLLIRAGDVGLDPTAASLTCVRTRHAQYGSTVYIPGSSLKGVLRSAAESMMRERNFRGIAGACDPLHERQSCGRRLQEDARRANAPKPTSHVHREHCLACRLFGSEAMKGRASVRDLFPWDAGEKDATISEQNRYRANNLEMRHGVSIDRIFGSVKHGPFDQEMVPAGVSFWGEIALENYQVWQLGLLAQAFDEVNTGFAQLGSTKSRGLGVATIELMSLVHEQRGLAESSAVGVGKLASAKENDDYGLFSDAALPESRHSETRGIATRFTIQGTSDTQAWLAAGLQALGALQ